VDKPWVASNILKEAFPEMPVGEAFQALFDASAAKSNRFAVLVIRIDDLDKTVKHFGEDIASGIVARLARIIDALSKAYAMEWGRLNEDRFACFCPDMDEEAAVQSARQIQQRLAVPDEQSLSIGIAVYPFWPFERTSILANAKKALDHAAFFGPGAVTPFDAVSLNISADKLYQYGDMEGAIKEFERALAVDPKNVNVHNSLGVCHGVRGNLDWAIDAFETAIALDPEDVMATYNLGLAHLKQGNRDKALELFLKAHSLDGEHPDIACQIGLCYRDMGRTEAALGFLEKAALHTPKWGHVFRALGDCYLEKERLPEAVKAYEKAIKRHPTDPTSLSALGHLYGELGENIEIAIMLCRESTTLDPDNGLFRYRLGKLYLQQMDYEKAIEQLKMAADLGEDCRELLREAEDAVAWKP
jgi:tetratricopeptide (TPR) repeat protein